LDTYGELTKFYALSDVVFVGGSIVDKGGQNPIEPAAYSKPVVFGMHMQNFREEAEILKKYEGAVEVKDRDGLLEVFRKMLSDKEYSDKTGGNAHKAVESQKGAVDRAVKIIESGV
jgi:3-deoxy-D-manno-octulosonic-acid transferase